MRKRWSGIQKLLIREMRQVRMDWEAVTGTVKA